MSAVYEKQMQKLGGTHWFKKTLYPRSSKIRLAKRIIYFIGF